MLLSVGVTVSHPTLPQARGFRLLTNLYMEKQVCQQSDTCIFDKQVFFIVLYFIALSYMQYRLRHPSFTAPRGPPSPKVREKAKGWSL